MAVPLSLSIAIAGCGSSSKSHATTSPPASSDAGGTSGTIAAGGSGTPIALGNLGSYTGPESSTYTAIRDGLQAWADYVNASGGLNGHLVHVYSDDDAGSPAQSAQELRNLVGSKHIAALAAAADGNTDTSWASYLAQVKVPVVGGLDDDPIWTTSPMYYSASPGITAKLAAYLLLGKDAGLKKAYIFYDATLSSAVAAVGLVKAEAQSLGVDVVGESGVSPTDANYSSVCLQAKASGAQFVASILTATTEVRVAGACAQQGFNPKYTGAGVSFIGAPLAAAEFQGSYIYDDAFPSTIPAAATFRTAMARYEPNTSLDGAVNGWLSGVLLEEALKDIPADQPVTAADVISGLDSITNDNLGGLAPQGVTFEKGQPHKALSCLFKGQILNHQEVFSSAPLCVSGT